MCAIWINACLPLLVEIKVSVSNTPQINSFLKEFFLPTEKIYSVFIGLNLWKDLEIFIDITKIGKREKGLS